jgi:hypothetical protein
MQAALQGIRSACQAANLECPEEIEMDLALNTQGHLAAFNDVMIHRVKFIMVVPPAEATPEETEAAVEAMGGKKVKKGGK